MRALRLVQAWARKAVLDKAQDAPNGCRANARRCSSILGWALDAPQRLSEHVSGLSL